MSAQSGIAPSEQLVKQFNKFISEENDILMANIIDETVQLHKIINEPSLKQSFASLQAELADDKPFYIVVKHEDEGNGVNYYSFISFVPDYAAVKQKMIYASSRNNMIRQLGSDYFKHSLFLNEIDELTFDSWKRSISGDDDSNDNVLSRKEQELQSIKNHESSIASSVPTSTTKKQLVTHANNFSFKFNENANFQPLVNHIYSLNLNMAGEEEVYLSNQQTFSSINDILSLISDEAPQFNIVNYKDKVYFIYSCPSGSKVKDRMVYASNKLGVINHLKSNFEIYKTLEVGDAIELELSEFEVASDNSNNDNNESSTNNDSSLNTTLKFKKPSRPSRKR